MRLARCDRAYPARPWPRASPSREVPIAGLPRWIGPSCIDLPCHVPVVREEFASKQTLKSYGRTEWGRCWDEADAINELLLLDFGGRYIPLHLAAARP